MLGGDSEVLDLGRAQRLFTRPNARPCCCATRTCRAEGCDIPGTWAEAHHWIPWHHNGPTDLDNGVLLCRHHHVRAHDNRYTTQRLPNGEVRYARRI